MTERSSEQSYNRRTVLRQGLSVSTLILGSLALTPVGQAQDSEDRFGPGGHAYDVDQDGDRDVVLEDAPDPAENRGFVVRATSNGRETHDYAAAILPIGGIPLTNLDTLSYDYYETPRNDNPAPDEVWLMIVTGAEESRREHVVFQSYNDGDRQQSWETRNVHEEIQGDRTHNGWQEVISTQNIRTRPPNLVDGFDETARLVRVGIGVGGATTVEGRTVDIYFDNFRVNDSQMGLPTTP